MGVPKALIKLLMREGNRERFFGDILTIGKQDIYARSKDIKRLAHEMNFQLKKDAKTSISKKEEFRIKGYISDNFLFHSLGFNNIDSVDYNDFEQCTILHDLNKNVPKKLHNKYDLILDGGTSGHIFNLPKVLENYNKMLKVGGRIIHFLPASNFVDHGFYMFSPTLLQDYYSANKWNIQDALFIKFFPKQDTKLWDIYEYNSVGLSVYSFGGLNKGMYANFFVIKKTNSSTFNANVQQGRYLKTWKASLDKKLGISNKRNNRLIKKISNQLPNNLRHKFRPLYYRILTKIPLKLRLKRIARY